MVKGLGFPNVRNMGMCFPLILYVLSRFYAQKMVGEKPKPSTM